MMQWEKDYWAGVLVGGISATIGISLLDMAKVNCYYYMILPKLT